MKIHHLEQGSRAWLDFRKTGVTASEIPVIMGKSPYQKIDELWLQKIGEAPETEENYAMRRGKALEPVIRERFHQIMGDIYEPLVVSNDKFPWMIASLDGYHKGPKDSAICEIKFNGAANHAFAKQGKLPEHHMLQVQFQLFVAAAEIAFYVSSNGTEEDIEIVEVRPDYSLIHSLMEKAQWFYNCVITRTPPNDPISDDLITLIEEYQAVAIEAKKLDERLDELKGIIRDITPREKSIAWGKTTCAWRSRQGVIDYKSIPDLIGLNLELYRKPPTEYFEIKCRL